MFADVPQTVSLPVATRVVYRAEVRIARRNYENARSFAIRCKFTDVHGTGSKRRGRITTCSFRVYRHVNQTGQIKHLTLAVSVVPRVADATFEDGSGWAKIPVQKGEHVRRSLYLNPAAL